MFNHDTHATSAPRTQPPFMRKTPSTRSAQQHKPLLHGISSAYSSIRGKAASCKSLQQAADWTGSFWRHALPALCACVGLFVVLYYVVRAIQTEDEGALTTESTQRRLGYMLLMVGYLLVPGVAGLLVRRRKAVAEERAMVEGVGGGLECCAGAAAGWRLGGGRIAREVEKVAPAERWVSVGEEEEGGEEEECCICLMAVEEGAEVRVLRCRHVFHCGCVDGWVLGMRKNFCPLCSARVVAGRDERMRQSR